MRTAEQSARWNETNRRTEAARRARIRAGAPPSWMPDPNFARRGDDRVPPIEAAYTHPIAIPLTVTSSVTGDVFVVVASRSCEVHGARTFSGRCPMCAGRTA